MLFKFILFAFYCASLILIERRQPLRVPREDSTKHLLRNVIIGALGFCAIQLIERPVAQRLSRRVVQRRQGVLNCLPFPNWMRTILGIIAMDYTLYWWHVLLHKVPFLWRFHLAHHIDRDLDTSTALRFHFGELLPSVLWRALQIRVLGINPDVLRKWQALLVFSVLFHHSNMRLPIRLERFLSKFIVTPRMHGIHHSIVPAEQNSNWSSGLTLWDALHRTLKLNVPSPDITIGVEGYQDPSAVSLQGTLLAPYSAPLSQAVDVAEQSAPAALSGAALTSISEEL